MLTLLTALALAAQPAGNAADCVLSAIPEAQHAAIGEGMLARKTREVVENSALLEATDDCARRYKLSARSAVHASGYASMHLTAKAVARQLGHPEWARYAVVAVRERTPAQRLALSEPEAGAAEFKIVLARMAEQDSTLVTVLRAWDDARAQRFIMMVRMFAVAEVERDKAALP